MWMYKPIGWSSDVGRTSKSILFPTETEACRDDCLRRDGWRFLFQKAEAALFLYGQNKASKQRKPKNITSILSTKFISMTISIGDQKHLLHHSASAIMVETLFQRGSCSHGGRNQIIYLIFIYYLLPPPRIGWQTNSALFSENFEFRLNAFLTGHYCIWRNELWIYCTYSIFIARCAK